MQSIPYGPHHWAFLSTGLPQMALNNLTLFFFQVLRTQYFHNNYIIKWRRQKRFKLPHSKFFSSAYFEINGERRLCSLHLSAFLQKKNNISWFAFGLIGNLFNTNSHRWVFFTLFNFSPSSFFTLFNFSPSSLTLSSIIFSIFLNHLCVWLAISSFLIVVLF